MVPVCPECRKTRFSVPPPGTGFCSVCGRILVSEKGLCVECRNGGVLKNVDRIFPIFPYRLWNAELLRRWKMNGERSISEFFSDLMKIRLDQIQGLSGGFSIVPVPPRPLKIRREGWDQVEELSVFLEKKHGLSVHRILERRSSVQQKSLDRNGRISRIGLSYFLREGVSAVPERICVLDDVVTTGSTLEEIASLLKSFGAREVMAATLFSVDS